MSRTVDRNNNNNRTEIEETNAQNYEELEARLARVRHITTNDDFVHRNVTEVYRVRNPEESVSTNSTSTSVSTNTTTTSTVQEPASTSINVTESNQELSPAERYNILAAREYNREQLARGQHPQNVNNNVVHNEAVNNRERRPIQPQPQPQSQQQNNNNINDEMRQVGENADNRILEINQGIDVYQAIGFRIQTLRMNTRHLIDSITVWSFNHPWMTLGTISAAAGVIIFVVRTRSLASIGRAFLNPETGASGLLPLARSLIISNNNNPQDVVNRQEAQRATRHILEFGGIIYVMKTIFTFIRRI